MIYDEPWMRQEDDHDRDTVTLRFKSKALYEAWRVWWHDAGGEQEWFGFLDSHGVDDLSGDE